MNISALAVCETEELQLRETNCAVKRVIVTLNSLGLEKDTQIRLLGLNDVRAYDVLAGGQVSANAITTKLRADLLNDLFDSLHEVAGSLDKVLAALFKPLPADPLWGKSLMRVLCCSSIEKLAAIAEKAKEKEFQKLLVAGYVCANNAVSFQAAEKFKMKDR